MDNLLNLEPRYVAPDFASISESAWYVMEDSEKTYNEMMQSLAINELAVLEATGEPISNEQSGEKAKGKIITWLQNAWQAVKGFFEKAWRFITEKVSSLKAKLTKFNASRIKRYISMISDKDKKGNNRSFGKYYEYTNLAKYINADGEAWKALKAYEAATKQAFISFRTSEKDDAVSTGAAVITSDMMDAKAKLLEDIGLTKEDAEASVQKKVKEIIRGKEIDMDLAFVKNHIDDMLATCNDPKKIIKDTKKMYNDIKKSYNDSIKDVKSYKKNADPKAYSAYLPYLKFGKNFSTAVASAALSCAKDKIFSDMKVVMRLQSAINKSDLVEPEKAPIKAPIAATAEEPKMKNTNPGTGVAVRSFGGVSTPGTKTTTESSMMESSVFTTELRSLFDF